LKAALTGATGFLGSHLAERLLARGDTLTLLVRSRARLTRETTAACRVIEGDLEDEAALARLVDGQDVVYHVAGVVAARQAGEFARTNRDGAARVARAARRAGAGRLVLVSSLAATGPSRPGETVDEDSGPGPVTEYGRSKLAGERAVRDTGVPLTIVRPPAAYGPRDRAFLPLFRAARRGFVPLLGDGGQELTLVHARDLACAVVAAATSPRTLGRTYHTGHPVAVSQRELARAVARAVGRSVRLVALPAVLVRSVLGLTGRIGRGLGGTPLLDGDKCHELLAPGWACSSEALRLDAGWRADIALADGLADTAASYRELGWI
jgi:nucleoside-diphosphate-sugar epimerase